MRIGDAFPGTHLKASDLQGREVAVIMERVEVEEIGRERDRKPVLYFRGKEKGLVLNKTNANVIAKMYGDETGQWAGKAITIYETEVEFGGDMVACIRVRTKPPVMPASSLPSPPPPPSNDIDPDEVPF